jgi:hypothetical protein
MHADMWVPHFLGNLAKEEGGWSWGRGTSHKDRRLGSKRCDACRGPRWRIRRGKGITELLSVRGGSRLLKKPWPKASSS